MVSVWVLPPSGNLLNSGLPWRRGDQASVHLELTPDARSDLDRIELIGGQLPPGLFYYDSSQTIQGTIGALTKDTINYPVVFRVFLRSTGRTYDRSFRFVMDVSDEEQFWSSPTGIQNLGSVNRGSSVTIQLNIVNPDQDRIQYKAVGYEGPVGSHQGLPYGLEIDHFGRVVGSPTITGNQAGDYYFRVYARDPDDLISYPRGEGSPRTSEKIYRLNISSDIVLDARLSDVVSWETPAGSLGSCYETYPSHFSVHAVPQYQIAQGNTSENQTIRYTLTPNSNPLPSGLMLDPASGLILGRCPYVSVSKTFEFIVEARVVFVNRNTGEVRISTIASERTFNITVRSIFATDSVTSLQINVPGFARQKIAQWIWGNRAEIRGSSNISTSSTSNEIRTLSRDQLYRDEDQYFGRVKDYKILLTSGLNYQTGDFVDRLKDYHHPTELRIGQLASARARSPTGDHLYDVIYLGVIDPMEGAGGFNSLGQEENLNRYVPGQRLTAIPKWNLTAETTNYYPNSIKNLRADLINRNNRLPGSQGYGTVGKEGLPLWMLSEQELGKPDSILGYQCAIELAHVKAGSGPAVVRALTTAGINEELQGTTITVDRYLLRSDGFVSTTFYDDNDGYANDDDTGEPSYLEIITFDGPENTDTPTVAPTTFDISLQFESKYYKFPPGDK